MACADWGSDQCTGGSCLASDSHPGYSCDDAFDDAVGTNWQTLYQDAGPHWIYYDFGSGVTKQIERVKIYQYANYGCDFKIQGSNNASDWTDLWDGSNPGTGSWQTIDFTNADAYRYIRLLSTGNYDNADWHWLIREIEMFECQDLPPSVSAEPLTANFLLQAFPLISILAEPLIATGSLLGPPLRPITAEPLVATTFLSGSPLELVSIVAEPLVGNLSLSSLFVVTYDVATEPLIADTFLSGSFVRSILATPLSASFSISTSIKQFLVSTLSLILGIEVGSSLTLINSLNLDIESQLRLLNNILTSLSGNRTFKLTTQELAQVENELRLISHILDEDSGKTYGDFYFSKPHGIT